MTGTYETIDHTGDAAVSITGDTLADVFETAAWAMMDVMGAIETPKTCGTLFIDVEGIDVEDMLVRWLSELNFMIQTRKELYTDFEVAITGETSMKARLSRMKTDDAGALKEIKAVTYHKLAVKKIGDRYEAFVVFDL